MPTIKAMNINGDAADGAAVQASPAPEKRRRDHPVFSALTGFYTGLALVIVVPGGFAAMLNTVFSFERAEELFPFVLLVFVIPIVLITAPRTRRFGGYMLLGMLLTAIVVGGVAALMLWLLIRTDG